MEALESKKLKSKVRSLYERKQNIWSDKDIWGQHSLSQNWKAIERFRKKIADNEGAILNLGAGNNLYGFDENFVINVDIAFRQVSNSYNSVVADAEHLPFKRDIFQLCICVGAVVNYCSMLDAINQISNCLKRGGYLILHVELSSSFEHFGKPWFRKEAQLVRTFYDGSDDDLWVYNENFVLGALAGAGLNVLEKYYYHILAPLVYRITGNEYISSVFARCDKIIRPIPGSSIFAESLILLARKNP